ncbi:MAG: indolepyruvate oxidoreductase subunit beta [Gemmatimonadota bacterium]
MNGKGTTNVLFAGVGGQGIVLASSLLATVCLAAGHDVKQSEVHGMAQRGGSVTSHVRFGPTVHSPTIAQGEADYLVAFELLEAARWLGCLAADGTALVNTQRIEPITVTSGATEYPSDLEDRIREGCAHPVLIDAFGQAQQAGSVRAVNMVLLGSLATRLGFGEEVWHRAISERVPSRTFTINWKAFGAGRQL